MTTIILTMIKTLTKNSMPPIDDDEGKVEKELFKIIIIKKYL